MIVDWELNEHYERAHCKKCELLKKRGAYLPCKAHRDTFPKDNGKKIDGYLIRRLSEREKRKITNQGQCL